jgi:hypothetical protein
MAPPDLMADQSRRQPHQRIAARSNIVIACGQEDREMAIELSQPAEFDPQRQGREQRLAIER